MAQVQARCSAPFVDADATAHEERMTRQNARLRRRLVTVRQAQARGQRFLQLLADSTAAESPEQWADRAAMTWCAEPEVNAARVVWHDPDRPGSAEDGDEAGGGPQVEAAFSPPSHQRRPSTREQPSGARGRARASIQLWCSPEASSAGRGLVSATGRRAWEAWAALLADRARLERRLQAVVASSRQQVETEEARLRQGKLDALGEFAAGAGHELNNPLAVIVGRTQLLLARTEDPEVARSLRIILNQAQRTHRILRDLIFVARPPAPRCRPCRPSELLGSLLREFERECTARGVRLLSELDDSPSTIWADPDALRHLAEILLRNALQATPAGGKIQVRSTQRRDELIWLFIDTGQGILTSEAAHLFDPFFCGRQAGRGLGLGLPRAARIVDQAGGQIRWSSTPGHETIFQVQIPLPAQPHPASQTPPANQAPTPHPDRLLSS
jgi:signal transduction histidine kinase